MSENEIVSLQELQYAVENVGSFDLGDFNLDSLKSILNLIEKQSKEIEELKRANDILKNQEETARKINELLIERYSNSVPKQKIRDKIEECKSGLLEIKDNDYYYIDAIHHNQLILFAQRILKELLEGEE